MNNLTENPSKRLAVYSMVGIAVCNAIGGIIQITDEQSSQTTIVGIEHVTLACLTATLLLLIPVMFHFAGMIGSRKGAVITTVGCVALAALTVTSNVNGEDYSFFPAVAAPSNLAIVAGFIVTAVGLHRHSTMTGWKAALLPLMWFVALPLSTLGGGLLVAAYWASIAWMTEHDRITPKAPGLEEAPAQAGNAVPAAA